MVHQYKWLDFGDIWPSCLTLRAFYSAPVGERSIVINLSVCLCVYLSVCLSVSISLEALHRSSWNFMCRSPVAVARSSSGGVAIRYVLPVYGWRHAWQKWAVWRCVDLSVAKYSTPSGVVRPGHSVMSMNALFRIF